MEAGRKSLNHTEVERSGGHRGEACLGQPHGGRVRGCRGQALSDVFFKLGLLVGHNWENEVDSYGCKLPSG